MGDNQKTFRTRKANAINCRIALIMMYLKSGELTREQADYQLSKIK